tara:strand:+ start:56 stop:1144 length:1089 start_codon:yes stop_codon:yes gene_type:complete
MASVGVLRKQDNMSLTDMANLAMVQDALTGGKSKQLDLGRRKDATGWDEIKEDKKYKPKSLIEQEGIRQAKRDIPTKVPKMGTMRRTLGLHELPSEATQEQVYDAATRGAELGGKALDWGSKGWAGLQGLIALQRANAQGADALSALGSAGTQAYTSHQMLNPAAKKTGANIGGRIGRNVAVRRGTIPKLEPSVEPVEPYVAPPSVHAGYTPPPTVPKEPPQKHTMHRDHSGNWIQVPYDTSMDTQKIPETPTLIQKPFTEGGQMKFSNESLGLPIAPPMVASPMVAPPTNTDITNIQAAQTLGANVPTNVPMSPVNPSQETQQTPLITDDEGAINAFNKNKIQPPKVNHNTEPGSTGYDGS